MQSIPASYINKIFFVKTKLKMILFYKSLNTPKSLIESFMFYLRWRFN